MRRVGDLKGPGSKVNDVLTELFPMLDVERVPGELLFLAGTHLGIGSVFRPGVIAENGIAQLFNPDDSGTIVTLSSCVFSTNNDQVLEWEVGAVTFGPNLGNNILRDTRTGASVLSVAELHGINQLASITGFGQLRVLAGQTVTLNDQNGVAILFPGSGFAVGTTVNNTALYVNFFWRERPFEPSEVNF